ncbi:hypothetical protein [uncultured Jatrophihabitans sp.]|uniref:hypothetical protein n=1 Tax=uncultured Jatrophihabitans sp. TaxID=1610747 RepID=UPI0035CA9049
MTAGSVLRTETFAAAAATRALPRSPQLVRLARLMATTPGRLDVLAGLPEDDLRTLHDQVSEYYFAAGRDHFARVAGLSNLLPATLVGRLAERFLPPHLGARAAEQLEPAKARDLVHRVSLRYLADLALALDPSRAGAVIAALPPARVAEVARELFGRGEHAAAAELAASVSGAGMRAALGVARGRDLLAVLPLLCHDARAEAALDRVSAGQLAEAAREAAGTSNWAAVNCLADRLPALGRRRLSIALVEVGDDVYAAFAAAAARGDLEPAAQDVVDAAAASRPSR